MEIKKYIYWPSFLAGFLVWLFFKFFWRWVYRRLGVTWNSYTQYAIELSTVLIVGVIVGVYLQKKEKRRS